MKLYATTISERASKGQGGNDFIHVHFKGEREKGVYIDLGYVRLEIASNNLDEEFWQLGYYLTSANPVKIMAQIKKGNKQKTANLCEVTGCKNINASPYAWCKEHIKNSQ